MSYSNQLLKIGSINLRLNVIRGNKSDNSIIEPIRIGIVEELSSFFDINGNINKHDFEVGRVIAALDKIEEALHTLEFSYKMANNEL